MRIVVVLLLLAGIVRVSGASAQDLDPREIRTAIEQGVRFLKNRQRPNGNWDYYASHERCGTTALAVLAMVECGVPKNDPAVERAMQYLRLFTGRDAGRNYGLSLQTMAFCLVDPERDRPLIRKNVELLEQNQIKHRDSEHNGGWDYLPGSNRSDLSNSQFSILALYEAERVGVPVKRETWQRAHRYWMETQNGRGQGDGSWGYVPVSGGGCSDARGSMTCAGVASTIITSGMFGGGSAFVQNGNVVCFRQPNRQVAETIQRGLDYMGRVFKVSENPGTPGVYLFYYLYALERVGRLTNQRFIGEHDWYREGADKLLQLRDPIDGAWRGQGTGDEPSTALALLFLAKGRRPVLMSKIKFGRGDFWNTHPNDADHLTRFTESQWKLDLTWQIIDLDAASPDDLLQSPVLYFSGNRTPLVADEVGAARLAAKLRDYLDRGGFILAEAQPNDRNFDGGFRELMRRVFPEPGYELALLDESHPIWSAEIAVSPEQLRPIEGVHFGCRTSVVYIPVHADPQTNRKAPSLSCLWEVADLFRREEPYPPRVRAQVDAALGIGLNILAYATNRELKTKDEIPEVVAKQTSETQQRRGRVFLGRLDHSGGAGSAPRAAANLLQWSAANLGLPVESRTETIPPDAPSLFEYPILFMHGRNAFVFTATQREKLREHLDRGGFLFVDAVCSAKPFADAVREEIRQMFPGTPLERIPADDPLFSEDYGGFDLRKAGALELRLPERAPDRKMIAPVRRVAPELYGVKLRERWAVVLSPYDVSCALERAGTLECRGYTSDSAMRLAVNVLLYALEH